MIDALRKFLHDDTGLETVEWAIIAGLIVSAIIALLIAIGNWVKSQYTNMKTELKA